MKKLGSKNVLIWMAMACRASNHRRFDSDPQSLENLKNIDNFVTSGGWSDDHPAILTPLGQHWLWNTKAKATQRAKDEMKSRASTHVTLQKAVADTVGKKSEDSNDFPTIHDEAIAELNAFETLFCEQVKGAKKGEPAKMVLRDLTTIALDDLFEGHSGHQRIEYVVRQAYARYLIRLQLHKLFPEQHKEPPEFSLTIPSIIKTFDDRIEAIKDQMQGNSNASIQNRPTVIDYYCNGYELYGDDAAPGITAEEFRYLSADSTKLGDKGGGTPLFAFTMVELAKRYRGETGLHQALTADQFVSKEGEKKPIGNPDYIDIQDFATTNKDPLSNGLILVRVTEPGLFRTDAYWRKYSYGNTKLGIVKGSDKDKITDYEDAIRIRQEELSEEEFTKILATKHKYQLDSYAPPARVTADEKDSVDKAEVMKKITNANNSQLVRQLLASELNVPLTAGGKPPVGVADSLVAKRDAIDAVFAAQADDPVEKTFLGMVETLGSMREGNKSLFEATVEQCAKIVSKAQTGSASKTTKSK